MKTITMYELLGLVKDGKAPKYIKYDGIEWEYTGYQYQSIDKENFGNIWNGYNFNILNDEVEIIEEEKKIPEKIEIYEDGKGRYFIDKHCKKFYITCDGVIFMVEEFNQLIDYLKSKGE